MRGRTASILIPISTSPSEAGSSVFLFWFQPLPRGASVSPGFSPGFFLFSAQPCISYLLKSKTIRRIVFFIYLWVQKLHGQTLNLGIPPCNYCTAKIALPPLKKMLKAYLTHILFGVIFSLWKRSEAHSSPRRVRHSTVGCP